jgi:hypothetical protein
MVTVGTFNLNNLFSRFNFRAEISHDQGGDGRALEASYTFADPDAVRVRRYQGRLVTGNDEAGRAQVAQRLLGSHPSIQVHPPEVDVWAVQEVEARQAASGEDWPAPETPRVRAKAGRKTVDLPPQRYAALIEWRAESPRQLGVARVIGQKVLAGLVELLLTDATPHAATRSTRRRPSPRLVQGLRRSSRDSGNGLDQRQTVRRGRTPCPRPRGR